MSDRSSVRFTRGVQAIWLALALGGIAFWGGALVAQRVVLQTACHPASACQSFQLNAAATQALGTHGISLVEYTVSISVILALIWTVWYGPAALIIWRRPRDGGALLAAYFLVVFPLVVGATLWLPASTVLSESLYTALPVGLLLFGLLFPDGRFAPRWTRWLAAAAVLALLLNFVPPIATSAFWLLPVIVFPIAVVGAQVHRFRHLSTWVQRQQMKWALFGLVVAMLGFIAITVAHPIAAAKDVVNGSLYGVVETLCVLSITTAIPISMSVAILRNRLWDIDRVINRALVYLVLTATLAGVYVGMVIGLQGLSRLLTGNGSTWTIALSTLLIAALFGPLRQRIQRGIDRRFYRSKYDAQKTLALFGERLRDEVDVVQLSRDLNAVVHETLHPEHVSLWIRGGISGMDER